MNPVKKITVHHAPYLYGRLILQIFFFILTLTTGSKLWAAPGMSIEYSQGLKEDAQAIRLHISRSFDPLWEPFARLTFDPLWELTIGHLAPKGELVQFGSTWEASARGILMQPIGKSKRWFGEAGFGVVLLSRKTTKLKDGELTLGSHIQFRTHLGLGVYLDRERRMHLLYRIQHTSNGSISTTNSGYDSHGVQLGYNF